MRLSLVMAVLVQLSVIAVSQGQATQSSFEVATVRPSQQDAGPDYNNQITYSPDGFTGRNVTLRRLVAEAWQCQFSIPAADSPNVPARAGGAPIPVLDKTGLQGTYEFSVDLRPELGTDAFTAWERALEDQLGLTIESRKADVAVVVVDEATEIPTPD
jgi:hypothetical protein